MERELFHRSSNSSASIRRRGQQNISRGERAGCAWPWRSARSPELLLILDDPRSAWTRSRGGPAGIDGLCDRKADRTIIFSSHLLADIERMADHIAVLDYSVLRANARWRRSEVACSSSSSSSRQAAGSFEHSWVDSMYCAAIRCECAGECNGQHAQSIGIAAAVIDPAIPN